MDNSKSNSTPSSTLTTTPPRTSTTSITSKINTSKPVKLCHFYQTPQGCRFGNQCKFRHETNKRQPIIIYKNSTNSTNLNSSNSENQIVQSKSTTITSTSSSRQKKVITNNNNNNNKEKVLNSTIKVPISYPHSQSNTVSSITKETTSSIRDIEIGQLERRFRSTFSNTSSKSLADDNDGTTAKYGTSISFAMIPTDPDFPFDLESLKITLIVPIKYPEQPCTIHIHSDEIPSNLSKNIEDNFNGRASISPRISLLNMTNWLDRNLEDFLKGVKKFGPPSKITFIKQSPQQLSTSSNTTNSNENHINDAFISKNPTPPNGHSHPQEQSTHSTSGKSELKKTEIVNDNPTNDAQQETITNALQNLDLETRAESISHSNTESSSLSLHSGVQLRLPKISLVALSLLSIHSLSISVKCGRCKTMQDFLKLSPSSNTPIVQTCRACHLLISLSVRGEILHSNSPLLAWLQFTNADPFDLLPSDYIGTCENCLRETMFKGVGHGGVTFIHCQGCHTKIGLAINEVKFVKIGNAAQNPINTTLVKKKVKQKAPQALGITLGQVYKHF